MSAAAIAWRIVADTAQYRLKKREMGNLVTSMTLAVALGLSYGDLAYRFAFGALLNLFVYLVNDCYDVKIDLSAPGRDGERTRFLDQNLRVAIGTCVALGIGLAGMGAAHGLGLLVAVVVNVVIIVAYSGWLKRHPVVDVLAMASWGVSMALVGFPITSSVGWKFAALLALLSMVTESIQVIRDEPSDRAAGVRTTAVAFGAGPTAIVARLLVVAAAAYTFLFLNRWLAPAFLLVLPAPLAPDRASRSWDAFRVVFGLTWLALLAWYWHSGALDGYLRLV